MIIDYNGSQDIGKNVVTKTNTNSYCPEMIVCWLYIDEIDDNKNKILVRLW